MVLSSLEDLKILSMSTTEDLTTAVREIESGLQNREKMSEQIADVEAWVVWYLLQKASRRGEEEVSVSDFDSDRQSRQIRENMAEAEKQSAVCEALLMKSKDISSELSVTENRRLHAKLTDLQEDITNITSYEKTKKQDLESRLQTQGESMQKVATLEKNLRQMLVDLNRHRFPVTRESLRTIEALKHMIVEHKSQVDQLHACVPLGKRRELLSVNWELYGKMSKLDQKARYHEGYLNLRQSVEDIQDNMEQEVFQTKEESRGAGERYRMCHSLLARFPLVKAMSEDAGEKLQSISSDLYPSQLTVERQRLEQIVEKVDNWEVEVHSSAVWTVGVARESVDRKGVIKALPANGFWTLSLSYGVQYMAGTSPPSVLALEEPLARVAVYLDYKRGLVSFYNAESMAHLYTFRERFAETLYPYFNLGFLDKVHENEPLKVFVPKI